MGLRDLSERKKLLLGLIFVAATAAVFLSLQPHSNSKAPRNINFSIPDTGTAERYVVDLYDEDGRLVARQEVSGGQQATFSDLSAETVTAVVTDPAGQSWSSGPVNVSGDEPIEWTETTESDPQPLLSFEPQSVLEGGDVITLPDNIEIVPGNAVLADLCCTMMDVSSCRGEDGTCARLDCNVASYGDPLLLFSSLSSCLVYSLGADTGGAAVSASCMGSVKGDFNGDGSISEGDLPWLASIRDYVELNGFLPEGLDMACADLDQDGVITSSDYDCMEGALSGARSFAECPPCSKSYSSEVCNDGVDNNCDGQTDRETYDNELQRVYGKRSNPTDVCVCGEATPCSLVSDVDGIAGLSSELDKEWCVAIERGSGVRYGWHSLDELVDLLDVQECAPAGPTTLSLTSTSTIYDGDTQLTYIPSSRAINSGISVSYSEDSWNFAGSMPVLSSNSPDVGYGDGSVIEIPGGYMMIFDCGSIPGPDDQVTPAYLSICVANSSDGRSWWDMGVLLAPDANDNGQASVPEAVLLPNGTLLVYYIHDWTGGNDIRIARYTGNGVGKPEIFKESNWRRYEPRGLVNASMDVEVIMISQCPVILRLLFTDDAPGKESDPMGIKSALSTDGIRWVMEDGHRLNAISGYEGPADPDIVFRRDKYLLYYGLAPFRTYDWVLNRAICTRDPIVDRAGS